MIQSHSSVRAGLHMALSRFCHSMLLQLAMTVLLLLTEAEKAYAKKKIPRCYKGCALNEKGKWVCRNGQNQIIYCYVAKGYSDTDDAPTPKPWQIDEDYFIDDYGESVLDIKDILDKNDDGADVPDSDIPDATVPIDQEGPMAVPYASSPIDEGGPMAVPYATAPIDQEGPMAVPHDSSPIDEGGPMVVPYASSPIDEGGPMAVPYASSPIDEGGPMAVPYASSPIDEGGPTAVPYASSHIDEGGPMAAPYESSPIDQEGPMTATPDSAEAPGLASTPAPASSPVKSDPFLYSDRRCTRGVPPCRVGCRRGRCCSNGNVFFCGPR
jgi:hypothetical protein